MADAITALNATPTTSVKPDAMSKINAGDFIKVMLAQLQQQDPMNPSDSNQLLTQMSQIGQLQSNTNMNATLGGLTSAVNGFTTQQSISSAAGLMGKYVVGATYDDKTQKTTTFKGNVMSIKVANNQVQLNLDDDTSLPLTSVTNVYSSAPAAEPAGNG